MTDKISYNQLKSICAFQRKFRLLKKRIRIYNNKVIFYKEILMSMLNNLSYCNSIQLYQFTELSYINILTELKEIKENLDNIPEILKIRKIKKNIIKINKCHELLCKYINHISPENILHILKLLFVDNWTKHFNKEEINKITFYSQFFKPFSIWISDKHKKDLSPMKKSDFLSKNILHIVK